MGSSLTPIRFSETGSNTSLGVEADDEAPSSAVNGGTASNHWLPRVCLLYLALFAYGSTADLGMSSTCKRDREVEEDGSAMSNLRKPSWPWLFAFLSIGWAKVRPEEVRARRWSLPAAIDTNLHNARILIKYFHGQGHGSERTFHPTRVTLPERLQ